MHKYTLNTGGWRRLSQLLLLLTLPTVTLAIEVQLPLRQGVVAVAEYHPGEEPLPTILLIHSFLQTHHFSTVQSIITELKESGYPVVAPTLSLGISHRKQSLSCEAVHAHSLQDDLYEIGRWLDWLKRQGHSRIITIGHSSGNHQLLEYLQQHADPAIIATIAVSLGVVNNEVTENGGELKRAQGLADSASPAIHNYSLAFCIDNYAAPASSVIGYLNWNRENVLTLAQLSPLPLRVINGADDRMLPERWNEELQAGGIDVTEIPGANHFFSGTSEFALLEAVSEQLEALGSPSP